MLWYVCGVFGIGRPETVLVRKCACGGLIVHLGELGSRATGDLLGAQADKLGLQLVKLLLEVVLALSHELAGLDLSGRLQKPR